MPTDVSDNFPRAAGSTPSAAPAREHADPSHEIRERLSRHGTVQLIGQPATMTQEAFRELVAAHFEAKPALVEVSVMAPAEQDRVCQVRRAPVHPVLDVVAVDVALVGAAGEDAALIS